MVIYRHCKREVVKYFSNYLSINCNSDFWHFKWLGKAGTSTTESSGFHSFCSHPCVKPVLSFAKLSLQYCFAKITLRDLVWSFSVVWNDCGKGRKSKLSPLPHSLETPCVEFLLQPMQTGCLVGFQTYWFSMFISLDFLLCCRNLIYITSFFPTWTEFLKPYLGEIVSSISQNQYKHVIYNVMSVFPLFPMGILMYLW